MKVTLRVTGKAAPEQAWERYAVPQRWPEWAPQISRVETDAERLAPGLTGRVVGPLGVSVRFRVDEVDEPARTWSWTVTRGPLTVRLHHTVEAAYDGCATGVTIDAPPPVALGYAPLARLALTRLVRP